MGQREKNRLSVVYIQIKRREIFKNDIVRKGIFINFAIPTAKDVKDLRLSTQ